MNQMPIAGLLSTKLDSKNNFQVKILNRSTFLLQGPRRSCGGVIWGLDLFEDRRRQRKKNSLLVLCLVLIKKKCF
jgi:hypothetical protein